MTKALPLALKALIGLCASLAAVMSQAVPIVINSNLPATRVSNGPAKNGIFNINSAAASLGFSPGYSIADATVSFSFADNGSFGFGDSGDAVTSDRYYSSSKLVSLPAMCGSTISSCTYP